MSRETGRQFKIRGMDCTEEIAVLKREVGPLVRGEEHLSFDLLKAGMTVLSPAVESASAKSSGPSSALEWEPRCGRTIPSA